MTHTTKERPILFNGAMVRALLAGTKMQTRRVIKDQQVGERFSHMTEDGRAHLEWLGTPSCGTGVWDVPEHSAQVASPYGQPGDRLWVREAWRAPLAFELIRPRDIPAGTPIVYQAHGAGSLPHFNAGKLRPGIHMPRWVCRLMLEITEVRVERLQDISEADALAEGIVKLRDGGYGLPAGEHYHFTDPRISYLSLWETINGAGSVEANPWVWAVTFRRLP